MSIDGYQKLQSLDESEFRDLLVILLRKMGFSRVHLNHGPYEYGKDIVFKDEGQFGDTYYAVIAKTGDISGSNDGSANLTNILRNINNQIEDAFDVPYEDVTSDDSVRHRISEVIVWTTGKISGKAEKQIIENLDNRYRHVRFRNANNTIAFLEKFFPSFFDIDDAVIANYFDKAAAKYSLMEERYSLVLSNSTESLPTTFVAPKLEILSGSVSRDAKLLHDRKQISFGRLVSMKSNTAIVGEMGTGKSTLLRRILLSIIAKNRKTARQFPIPVLLNFRDLNLNKAKPLDADRENVIESAILRQWASICGNDFERDLVHDLASGNLTLLMDGLDELDGIESIKSAMAITKSFGDRYPECRVIVASRIELLDKGQLFTGFKLYRLEEFSLKEIRQLVVNWFGKNTPDSRTLIRLIIQPMTMYSIPCTPLALTIIAVLFRSGKRDMPSNLTDLLQMYVDFALGRWDPRRNYSSEPNWSDKQQVLQKLSWKLISQGLNEVSTSDLLEFAKDYKYEFASTFNSEALVGDILERSGLIIRNENANLEFKHRSFLDYFSGKELNSQRNASEILVQRFGDPNWSKAIFFACGLLPHNEVYLEGIVGKVPPDNVDLVSYAFDMGFVAQAARHVNRKTKNSIVRRTLKGFVEAWNSLVQVFLPLETGTKGDVLLAYPYVVVIHSIMVGISIGSPTLAPALEDTAKDALEFVKLNPSLSESQNQRFELWLLLLAVACVNAGCINSFVLILETNRIANPVFTLIAEIEVRRLRSQTSLTEMQLNSTASLAKKLKRKLSNNKDYLRKSFKSAPMLLNEDSDVPGHPTGDWLLMSGQSPDQPT
ncbi:MAG: NACHT domain-containing protein [Chloroflexi bacterium]|nr:NACHT domain-containing protein [Chloroflexota bacterium]